MQRKKGFTLVELLVALTCAALVLSMVSAAVFFLSRMNNGTKNEGKTLFQLQTVKEFVQKNAESDLNVVSDLNYHYEVQDGKVLHYTWNESDNSRNDPTTVVSKSLIENIAFVESDDGLVWTCTITYDGGQTFTFVAYAKTTPDIPQP